MGERAALGVLPRDANGDAVDEKRCERERLRVPPVDAALLKRGTPAFELDRKSVV